MRSRAQRRAGWIALALDGAGRLYIYDEGQGRVVIFQ